MTGYIGNASFLREVAKILAKMRTINPNLIYGKFSSHKYYIANSILIISITVVCDPVMGDHGKMYVPEDLLPIYQNEIIPLADIITPNQYEVELLTGLKINNETDVVNALKWFHSKNIKTIALSSTDLGTDNQLLAYLSQQNDSIYSINIPKQGGNHITFTGTGDLFASLFLAHNHFQTNVQTAFEITISSLQAVIKRTIQSIPADVLTGKRPKEAEECELKLIQSKKDIDNPVVLLKAQQIQ